MKTSINEFLSKTWLYLLILMIFLVWYFFFEMGKKDLIIVSDSSHKTEEVKKTDPRVNEIWDLGDSFIFNKSNSTLTLKPIFYGGTPSSNKPKTIIINPSKNIRPVNPKHINVFEKPAEKVKTSAGTIKTRWHLLRN